MAILKFLNKKRIVTLTITLVLFILYVLMGALYQYADGVSYYPRFARAMLVITMFYVLGGCILQTLGHPKIVKLIGTIVFLLLCIFLFYSIRWYDFVIFALCMYLVLHRSSNLCDSTACNIEEGPTAIKGTEYNQDK